MAASSSPPVPPAVTAHAPCWEEVEDDGDGDDDGVDDDDDDEFEVPYSASLSAALAAAPPAEELPSTTVEVRLWRDGQAALGLVLDASNHVVALRPCSPAAAAFDEGRLHVGDQVLSVCGVSCSDQQRVGEVLRALGPKKVYELQLRRYAEPPAHLPSGATLREELAQQQQQAEQQTGQQTGRREPGEGADEAAAGGAAGAAEGGGRQLSIAEAAAQVEAEGGNLFYTYSP
eukprot:scaffold124253_cov39-Phaeocystis_antarctica.AAC.1